MEPTIKQLVLKRFRSVPSERITFDNPTIFVGRNGSGKSNLVSAFSFLADAMASPLQAVFDKAGGISTVRNRSSGQSYPPNLGLRVDFGRLNGKACVRLLRVRGQGAEELRFLGGARAMFSRSEAVRVVRSGGYEVHIQRRGHETLARPRLAQPAVGRRRGEVCPGAAHARGHARVLH